MVQQKKPNFKMPHSCHHNEQGQEHQHWADWFYEYEVCHMGSQKTKYRNPQDTKNFNSQVGPTGDIQIHDENDGDSIHSELIPNSHRHFTKNHSTHARENREKYSGGVYNKNTKGQHAKTTTQDDLGGAANNKVAVHSNEARVRKASNFVNASNSGIHIQTTAGENYIYHAGNVASTFGGAHYEITQKDRGIHVQKDGNLDFRVQKGKMQIQTGKGELRVKSGSTMVINAASKIEIKVGGSSITIESGKIKVKSGKIVLDGESHIGSEGGQLGGQCGGGCCSKTYLT